MTADTIESKESLSEPPLSETTESRHPKENLTMTPRAQERNNPAGETPSIPTSDEAMEKVHRLTDIGRANLETLSHASHTVLQGGMKCQEIMMAFANQRMQRSYQLFEDARSLTNPSDTIRLQTGYGRGLVEDTFRMIQDLAGVGEWLADENLARLQESTTETIVKMDEVA